MPKRVLIVDDSPSLRKLVFILSTSNEFSICGEAENGAQGIEKAKQTRPDIIVLDYSMPVMDGIRAAKSLKQLMPRVPLLLFTGLRWLWCQLTRVRDSSHRKVTSVVK